MNRERLLTIAGYDTTLLRQLSPPDRAALRGAAAAWLVACLLLGLAAGYAAALIHPSPIAPVAGGLGIAMLTINFLRVVNAGGGMSLSHTLAKSEAATNHYRPGLAPAIVFVVLAAILAQPAQLPFWPELDEQVETHRQTLITQHNIAATHLGTDADYYRTQLETAGFPIFRIQLLWKHPKRALRLTALFCLLVLLPTFWSQVISIKAHRAYERQRSYRNHIAVAALQREGKQQQAEFLHQWRRRTQS